MLGCGIFGNRKYKKTCFGNQCWCMYDHVPKWQLCRPFQSCSSVGDNGVTSFTMWRVAIVVDDDRIPIGPELTVCVSHERNR